MLERERERKKTATQTRLSENIYMKEKAAVGAIWYM